jgi:hypothetical protein
MMKRVLRIPTVVLLVLAGPLAGSASAHEFVVSKTGKGKIEATAPQIFRTSAVTVECAKASASMEFATLKSEVLDVAKLSYSECAAAGGVASATGSYDFNANGPITFTKAVSIQLEEAAECSIALGTKGTSHREMLSYKNNAGKVLIGVYVTGLTYTSSGGVCGAGGTNGIYEGTLRVSLEGGTVEWR